MNMTEWTEISKKQYDEFGKTSKAPAETRQILLEEENKDLKWQQKYEKEHKLRREAEGEMTIIKGIGMNSPEMKDAQKKIKQLEEDINILTRGFQIERETHQADMKSKDMEIGRLMSKINLK